MGVAMRRLLLAAAMAVTAASAQAADMPDFLRGSLPAISAPVRNWDGWYVGGQVGVPGGVKAVASSADLPILGEVAARLTHEPDRGAVDGLPATGTQESI